MSNSEQQIRDIIGHIAYQISWGWQAFLIAKYIHERRVNKRINCAYYFFNGTETSTIETAVLTLARLTIPDRERKSITIDYLLNYVEQHSEVFPQIQGNTMLAVIARHRSQLESLNSLIANIKEQRDRTIAHLDKLHITNPSAVYTHPPIDYQEVEKAFSLLLNIVNVYAGYLLPSEEIRLDDIAPNITDDVEYLTKLIEQDNAR
jgi:hypothetical protein